MAKKMRKMIALVLVLVLCVSQLALPVFAEDTAIPEGTPAAPAAPADPAAEPSAADPAAAEPSAEASTIVPVAGGTVEVTKTPEVENTETEGSIITTTTTSSVDVQGEITSEPVIEGMTEEEMPDISNVDDVNNMGDTFDDGENTWSVSEPVTNGNQSTVTLTREEDVAGSEQEAKLTTEELGTILGVTLTPTGPDTYTYVDADGVTVTVTVTDTSTEVQHASFSVTLTQTTEEVEVDASKDVSENEMAKEKIDEILSKEGVVGVSNDSITTYQYSDDTADYNITEQEIEMTAEELAALSNAELIALLGEGYSEADGKIVDAAGHELSISTEDLEGKVILRTMTKTDKLPEDIEETTEANAVQSALEQTIEGLGVTFDAQNLTALEEGGYTYTFEKDGKTYTYNVSTETGAPVVTQCPVPEEGADTCEETTVTVTATVTGETIVETTDMGELGDQIDKIVDGGEIIASNTDEEGVTTIEVKKGDATYIYTLTTRELTQEEKDQLMEEGKEYNFSQLKKASWTAVTHDNVDIGFETVEGVENTGNGTYKLTVEGQEIQVEQRDDGRYYQVGAGNGETRSYEIEETTKNADEIKAILEAKGYEVESVVQNASGYIVKGKDSAENTWEMNLPLLTSYAVTQRTANTEAASWSGDVTNDEALNSAKQSLIEEFIQGLKNKFLSLVSGEKIVLGSGENAKVFEKDKISDDAIEAELKTAFDANYSAWIEAGTAVNFSAMSSEALKDLLNDIANDAHVTEYDFNNYYQQGWKINNPSGGQYNTAERAQDAAERQFTVDVTTVNGTTYTVQRDRSGYFYEVDGVRHNVDARNVQSIVPNYHNSVNHLDLGINGTLKLQENGEWVDTVGLILPASGSGGVKVYWGNSAADVVDGNGDGVAEQSKNHIVQDQNTHLYEYNVHNGDDPTSSKFYRVEASFVYDPVTDENGNVKEFYIKGQGSEKAQIAAAIAANPGCYCVERRNDHGVLQSVQIFKKTAPMIAYGYMTRDSNTCSNMLSGGYDLTLSELTLIGDTVYAGGRGSINLSLNYEVIKSFIAEQAKVSGEVESADEGSGLYGSYTTSEYQDMDIVGTDEYSYHTAAFHSEEEKYDGNLDYTYITAEGEKSTVTIRTIDAELDLEKETTTTTPPPGGGNDGGNDGGDDGDDGDNDDGVPMAMNLDLDDNAQEPAIQVMDQVDADDLTTIDDEEVPLAAAPETGDISALWAAISMFSMSGAALLSRKKKDEE